MGKEPTDPHSNAAARRAQQCLAKLAEYERLASADPLTNSVRRLAYDLTQQQAEKGLSHADLAATAKHFCDEALLRRADAFGRAHGSGEDEAAAIVDAALAPLAGRPFEETSDILKGARAGIVFTAHPTFAMSRAMRAAFAERASAADDAQRRHAAERIAPIAHGPDESLSLADERRDAQAAILRAQYAVRPFIAAMLRWARSQHPDRWTELHAEPASIATWVGYDLDGRTDIHWGETLRIRLAEKALQLQRYAGSLRETGEADGGLAEIIARLENASAFAEEQASLFDRNAFEDAAAITRAANALTRDDPRRLVSLAPVIAALDAVIDGMADGETRLQLAVIRSEMRSYGLGVARIHLRINAAQVRSALRAELGLDPERGFIDRTTFDVAAERAKTVASKRVNIASIFFEQMTARRQLMLCAQILKHIDADTPIRFLIAECEAPATVMGAVYLARLYGVEQALDISPLFETPNAIERGGRFLDRLLAEPEFVAYIRARGRIAIQLGFSDSGRFMGQVAANLAIERLQILLSRAMAAHGLTDVEAVIFNTHGESMGRGGFPGTLADRFDFLMTPWARARFRRDGVRLRTEASYQGGDGFLHFETKALARATVAAMVRWGFQEPAADKSDSFYTDINYSWDFFRAVKSWQEALFDNRDYQASIGAFAPALLFVTGSRRARRQSGTAIIGPRSLRAIPHNAILQQLAAPANVAGGVGAAAGAEADRIVEMHDRSARLGQVLEIVRRARASTSLPVVRAYATLFDPAFWVSMAGRAEAGQDALACEELALHLSNQETATALARFANHLAADLAKLDRILADLGDEGEIAERRAQRRPMHALHAIRQAMLMRAFLLVASTPAFSQRHDVSRSTLFDLALALRFDELADLLETIFPAANPDAAAFGALDEPADDLGDEARGYPDIHDRIIRPLREIHLTIREIGVGISHFYGAYG